MVIGSGNGSSLLHATRKHASSTYRKRKLADSNTPLGALMRASLAPSRVRPGAAVLQGALRRAMGSRNTWHPSMGIRFSPSPERVSPYPPLDVGRFLHAATPVGDGSSEPGKLAHDAHDVHRGNEGSSGLHVTLGNEAPASGTGLVREVSSGDLDAEIAEGTESAMYTEESAEKKELESLDLAESPPTPKSFVMSTELFNAAKAAKAGTPASFWSHILYEHVNTYGDTEKVKVHYCMSKHAMELVCQKHFFGHKILGFDLEWSIYAKRGSGPRENVSLIQLASPGRIGLFQVAAFTKDDFVAPTFQKIMEDPNVRKAGVNIRGDCTRLKNQLGIAVQGVFELSHLYKQVKYSAAGTPHLINKSVVAMSIQAQEHLGLPLFKGSLVRTSNWQRPLTPSQILYAAADAYAGLKLYHVLDAKRKALIPCPPRPHHAELRLPIPLAALEAEPESAPDDMADEHASVGACSESTLANTPRSTTTKLRRPRAPTPQIPAPAIRDARIVEAERMAQEYRARQTHAVSRLPVLRAYYIWHVNEDLDPKAIARLLRDPPLAKHGDSLSSRRRRGPAAAVQQDNGEEGNPVFPASNLVEREMSIIGKGLRECRATTRSGLKVAMPLN